MKTVLSTINIYTFCHPRSPLLILCTSFNLSWKSFSRVDYSLFLCTYSDPVTMKYIQSIRSEKIYSTGQRLMWCSRWTILLENQILNMNRTQKPCIDLG